MREMDHAPKIPKKILTRTIYKIEFEYKLINMTVNSPNDDALDKGQIASMVVFLSHLVLDVRLLSLFSIELKIPESSTSTRAVSLFSCSASVITPPAMT